MSDMSPEINGLGKALCALQAQMTSVSKNAKGYNYTYSDLPSVISHITPLMAACELSYTQTGEILPDGTQALVTTLYHYPTGQWVRGRYVLISEPQPQDGKKKNINANQAFGSSISYMRRYALCALLGVVQDDDDGATASPMGQSTPMGADEFEQRVSERSRLIKDIQRLEYEKNLHTKHISNLRKKHIGTNNLQTADVYKLESYITRLNKFEGEPEGSEVSEKTQKNGKKAAA